MFINVIHFINTISKYVNFMTEEHIANAKVLTLQESIRQVKQVYMQRGFKITNILMGGKFTFIRGNLVELQININIYSNDEHVGWIEWSRYSSIWDSHLHFYVLRIYKRLY